MSNIKLNGKMTAIWETKKDQSIVNWENWIKRSADLRLKKRFQTLKKMNVVFGYV